MSQERRSDYFKPLQIAKPEKNDELAGKETVAEFLARGGKISYHESDEFAQIETGNYNARTESRNRYRQKEANRERTG